MRHRFFSPARSAFRMTINALYTDLSGYYDLLCTDIDYAQQSATVYRLHKLFGNQGYTHLDLACGTGPHVRHFIDFGFRCHGLDLNLPMLQQAQSRCPEASFTEQNMSHFQLSEPVDLITCFLYSIHYNQDLALLAACFKQVYQTLNAGGVFCFNAVNKEQIDNQRIVSHTQQLNTDSLRFSTAWHYDGSGDQQALQVTISKTNPQGTETWHDQHPMVAVSFEQLISLLEPYFTIEILEHDYEKIIPWQQQSGNALFVCVKRDSSALATQGE